MHVYDRFQAVILFQKTKILNRRLLRYKSEEPVIRNDKKR